MSLLFRQLTITNKIKIKIKNLYKSEVFLLKDKRSLEVYWKSKTYLKVILKLFQLSNYISFEIDKIIGK